MVIRMRIIYAILCILFVSSSISYGYEQVPEDAKVKKEDVSKEVIENQAPEAKSRLGKNTIANLSGNGAEETNVVLVDKSLKRLYIARLKGNDMEVLEEFPILTGRVDGNKIKRGDEKTPEGVYYVLSYSSGDELVKRYGDYALIYGAGSFPLNYPNMVDRIEKKTGGGIWLHGVKPDLDKTYTQGCVAMNNTHFNTLFKNIKVTTPTIIAEKLMYTDEYNYESTKSKVEKAFNDFINAWEKNNKQAFRDAVHTNFKTPGGTLKKAYTATKTNLMDIYPQKDIRNMNTKYFIKDEKYAVVDTEQFYCAPNLTTFTNKRYYFIDENGSLKLISEEVRSKPVTSALFLDDEIKAFVNNWASSWKSQDIEKYMENYDLTFKSGRDNYLKWKEKKSAIFAQNIPITLNISNIKWYYSKGVYTVEFMQEYSSGSVKDKGIKTLKLSGCPAFFKIKSETWRGI